MALVDVADLEPGMILSQDVVGVNHKTPLACKGVKVTPELIRKLTYLGIDVVNIQLPQEVSKQIISETTEVIKNIFDTVGTSKDMNLQGIDPVADKIVELIHNHGTQIVDEIFLLWKVDQYTFHHSIGTAFFAALIGKELQYTKDEIKDLVLGSLLHDLGKGLIPNEILNKPGKLYPHEFDEIKKHPYIGYKILKENSDFKEDILAIPLQHHERKDGNGYPLMIKEKEIHPYAKIASIADIFSALTTDRSYRGRVSEFEACEFLLSSANYALDTDLVNLFVFKILKGLENSWVGLNSGEVAKIISVDQKNPTRPKIAIYDGKKFSKEKDLSHWPELFIKEHLLKNVERVKKS